MSTEQPDGQDPRTSRMTAAERSAEITAAARALALEDGLTALTQRGVAERAGVASSLVAHYQPSMEALIAETFRSIAHDEIIEVFGHIAVQRDPVLALRVLIVTLLDGGRDDVDLVWTDAFSMARRFPALGAEVLRQTQAWHDRFTAMLQRVAVDPPLSDEAADRIAAQFLGMLDGLNAHAAIGHLAGRVNVELIARALEPELGLPAGSLSG
ncbi:TetR family transcriptional regulator [Microcella daejeonensis]|uniref:TetR/AcrR family transcriptional regulator n=1 Tax=Microcella daejeonensis TaxID=2994971 RepID=UPI0022705E23|nr:TetR family transcriptional regulator [Microcella daejeonensis]WAB85041.1 TetR family transcriptional regulator [Microcella daejeonensis]